MLGVVVGVGALVVGWLLLSGRGAEPGARLGSESERVKVRRDVEERQRDYGPRAARGVESGAAGAVAGAGIGAAFGAALGPLGAVIGAFVGFFVAAIVEAIGMETYGQAVREGVKAWLAEGRQPTSRAAIDAVLYREALFGAEYVYFREETGDVAIEVTTKRDRPPLGGRLYQRRLETSLVGFDQDYRGRAVIPGRSSRELREAIVGWNHARLDGPEQRRARAAWEDGARVGDLYVIQFRATPDGWRPQGGNLTDGPWFSAVHPYLAPSATRVSRDWRRVVPSPRNVDELAAKFDRTAGVDWKVTT